MGVKTLQFYHMAYYKLLGCPVKMKVTY